MSRQSVLRTEPDRRRAARIAASAMMGFALVGALLAGPPAAAQAAAPPPATAAAGDSCGGPVAFGAIVACPKIDVGARAAYAVATTVDGGRLAARLVGWHHPP